MKKTIVYGVLPLLMLLSACNSILPDGEYVTEERDVDVYNSVAVEGGLSLILTDRSDGKVSITTYSNIQPYIEIYVKEKQLIVRPRRNTVFSGNPKIRVNASGIGLNSIDASGGSDIESMVALDRPALSVALSGGSSFNHEPGVRAGSISYAISGGGRISGNVNAEELTVSLSGGSVLNLRGTVKNCVLQDCSGGSDVGGYDLVTETLSCTLSGGSKVRMTVLDRISVSASGGSQLRYKGLPQLIYCDLSGGSTVAGE